MNTFTLFSLEIFISLSMSFITLWILSKPLVNVLEDLCPTKTQADFWLAYTRIMLLISPLLLVLMVSLNSRHINDINSIKFSLVSSLAGLLLGMLIVGKKIFEPASKTCTMSEMVAEGE
jgi:hypothetical protein